MNSLKKLYYAAASLIPMSAFHLGGPNRILLPYHHLVTNKNLPHISHLYSYKNEKAFQKDLEILLKSYRPIHPDKLYSIITEGGKIPKGTFLLTFDDGFREIADIIAPILIKKGVPAIFFINPAFIDNKELFYRCKISLLIDHLKKKPNLANSYSSILNCEKDINSITNSLKSINQINAHLLNSIATKTAYSFEEYLLEHKPFLSKQQLIELNKQGFTIGAHSVNHPYYKLLSEEDQVRQSIDSCNYVKEITCQEICHFSFPHSDSDVSKKVIEEINIKNKGLLFGIQNQKEELTNNMLHRFNAERPGLAFDKLIKGQLFLNSLQKMMGKNIVNRT